jgi:hypothetical protein
VRESSDVRGGGGDAQVGDGRRGVHLSACTLTTESLPTAIGRMWLVGFRSNGAKRCDVLKLQV